MSTLIPAIGSCMARMTSAENSIQIMTMKVSKGLKFPVVALPGVGHVPAAGEDEQEAARASLRLVIGVVSG
jgi:ATP-dependent exoDNAse (exonuclease V) beta subunit